MELKHCTKEALRLLFAYDMSIGQCLKELGKKNQVFYKSEPILQTMINYNFRKNHTAYVINRALATHKLDYGDILRPSMHTPYCSGFCYQSYCCWYYWRYQVKCKSAGCNNYVTEDILQVTNFLCLDCFNRITNINSLISCIKSLQQIPEHWYQLEAYLNPVANFIRFSTGLRNKLLEQPKVQLQPTAKIQFRQLVLFNTRFQKHIAEFIKYI